MADMNKPRKDGMVRIPLHGGPDAGTMQYVCFHPYGPNDKPERSRTFQPKLGLYRLHGTGPADWRYVWQDRDQFIDSLKGKP